MELFGVLVGGPIASLLNCHAPPVKHFLLFIIPEFIGLHTPVYGILWKVKEKAIMIEIWLTYSGSLDPTGYSQLVIHYQSVNEVINEIENRLCYQLNVRQVSYLQKIVCRLRKIALVAVADLYTSVVWLLHPSRYRYIADRHPFYLCYFTHCLSLIIVKVYNPLLSFFADGQCLFLPYSLNDSAL